MLTVAMGGAAAWAKPASPDHPFTIDTMSPSSPDFDPARAVAAGLSAAVVDMEVPVRNRVDVSAALETWLKKAKSPGSACLIVRRDADFDQAMRTNSFGIVLACQDPAILDTPEAAGQTNLDHLREYYARGLRVLQLSYTDRSILGDGYRERSNAGLSELGLRVVTEMNRLGMLIDVSHCGDATTDEAIRRSSKPVAITHAGCRALFDSRRNKSDATIRLLAEHGGFFGVFNMTMWLTAANHSSVENIVDHIMHVRKIGGSGIAGFGSDFPVLGDPTPQDQKVHGMQSFEENNRGFPGGEGLHGHMSASDMDGPGRMVVLAGALRRRGLKAVEIDGILGENFRRVFRRACG